MPNGSEGPFIGDEAFEPTPAARGYHVEPFTDRAGDETRQAGAQDEDTEGHATQEEQNPKESEETTEGTASPGRDLLAVRPARRRHAALPLPLNLPLCNKLRGRTCYFLLFQ
ncbi:MAG: hypothetical protein C4551_05375 [Bacillota bacterium]|nr:MAG: hypothetical protein C4551_05375 [Bacillota bacterium]